MNRYLFTIAFCLGALAIAWVGAGFVGGHVLALMMTALIAAVYGFGALELRQFRQANASLTSALAAIPEQLTNLDEWLDRLPAALQNPVRLRIEGERGGLPGPALTPYLVGLLVMLGMLGTFLGMVVTLNGAAFSLDGTADLQTIRSALAAPIKGLGLAFGTSVAGVAASAMLGLMSALCRRERMLAAQLLDTRIATQLRGFSLAHQRQESYRALQSQARALPEVVDQLQAMMARMDESSRQLSERLIANQASFHSGVKEVYTDLASSVDRSLRDSLTQSAHVAGESIKPVVEAAMAGIAREATLMHERMMAAAQLQLDGLSARFGATASTVSDSWSAALARQERTSASMVSDLGQCLNAFSKDLEQRSGSLLATVAQAHAGLRADQAAGDSQRLAAWTTSLETMAAALQREWQQAGAQTLLQQQHICGTLSHTAQELMEQARANASHTQGELTRLLSGAEELTRARIATEANWMEEHRERMDQVARLLRAELGALRDEEAQRAHAAVERLGELQTALTVHLTTLGSALEDPITRLLETASEAPRAAAEVIGQLRREISSSAARDNELLEERSRILETLNSLLAAINHASLEQRAVIDDLVRTSAGALQQAGSQFSEKLDAETARLSDITAHVSSSAVEVASLSESLGFAVNSFNEANEKLIGNLQRIEAAMDKSMARSDEQLAYYVAQAREIIDLSILSQKEVFEALRQLPAKHVPAEEVCG